MAGLHDLEQQTRARGASPTSGSSTRTACCSSPGGRPPVEAPMPLRPTQSTTSRPPSRWARTCGSSRRRSSRATSRLPPRPALVARQPPAIGASGRGARSARSPSAMSLESLVALREPHASARAVLSTSLFTLIAVPRRRAPRARHHPSGRRARQPPPTPSRTATSTSRSRSQTDDEIGRLARLVQRDGREPAAERLARGEGARAAGGDPPQVRVPRRRLARAAHPAQRHHRLRRDADRGRRRRRDRRAGRDARRRPPLLEAPARADQQRPRLFAPRLRARCRSTSSASPWRRCSRRSSRMHRARRSRPSVLLTRRRSTPPSPSAADRPHQAPRDRAEPGRQRGQVHRAPARSA